MTGASDRFRDEEEAIRQSVPHPDYKKITKKGDLRIIYPEFASSCFSAGDGALDVQWTSA